MADLAVWQRTIVDEEGNVIPGAEVEVRREEDDSLATLYADRAGETPLANPLAADMSGFVRFFAQGDAYTITAVGAGSTRTWRFNAVGTAAEYDIGKLAFFESRIVRIPTDYPTMMDAIRDLYTPRMASGKEITLLLEKGYQIPSGSEAMYQYPSLGGGGGSAAVLCKYGDYSHFVVRSEDDAIIEVADNFSGSLFVGEHARMPRLECLIDMKGLGNGGYMPTFNSHGWIEEYCGVQNAGRWGARVRVTSVLEGRGAILRGAGERGFFGTHGSTAYMRDADCSNAGDAGVHATAMAVFDGMNINADGSGVGFHFADCGDAHIRNASALNCTGNALNVIGTANISAIRFDARGSFRGFEVQGGATVDLEDSDLSEITGTVYRIFSGANFVNLRGANVDVNAGTMQVGSIIATNDGLISRYGGDGSPGHGFPLLNQGRFGLGAERLQDVTLAGANSSPAAGMYGMAGNNDIGGSGWCWVHLPRNANQAAQIAVRSNFDEHVDLAAVRTAINWTDGEWTKWRQLIHTGRIVGPLSHDADGDPSGAIFQSGGTSAEGYILYADGTMECWTYVDLGDPTSNGAGTYEDPYRSSTFEWTFPTPVSFAGRPVINLTPHSDVSGSPARALTATFRVADAFRVTDVQVFRVSSNTNTTPVGVNIHAKGRWK